MPMIEFTPGEGGAGFTLVPEGTYDLEVLDVKQGSSSGGHMQVEMLTQVVGGPEDGHKVRLWYVITEKSGWKIKKLLDAVGLEAGDAGNGKFAFDPDGLLGAVFTVDAKHAKKPDGGDKNEWINERPSKLAEQPPAAAAPAAPVVAPAAPAAPAATGGFVGAARARRAQ